MFGPISPLVSSGDCVLIYLIRHLSQNLICLKTELKGWPIQKWNGINIDASEVTNVGPVEHSIKRKDEMIRKTLNKMDIMVNFSLDACKVIKKLNKVFLNHI